MTLRQYEAFLKTVACASVSAAARELGVSQSALTQLLAGLERDCGFPLLVRNRGGVHLTPAGKALLPAVEQVCAADAHLQHRIRRCVSAPAARSASQRSRASRSTGCRR